MHSTHPHIVFPHINIKIPTHPSRLPNCDHRAGIDEINRFQAQLEEAQFGLELLEVEQVISTDLDLDLNHIMTHLKCFPALCLISAQ